MAFSRYLAQTNMGTITGLGKFQPNSAMTDSPTQIENIFSALIGFLTIVGGLSFLVYFMIGALNWVTAGSDAKKAETAKTYMVTGAIGLIIIIAAYAIVSVVGTVLGLDIMNPAQTINSLFGGGDDINPSGGPIRHGPDTWAE